MCSATSAAMSVMKVAHPSMVMVPKSELSVLDGVMALGMMAKAMKSISVNPAFSRHWPVFKNSAEAI